MFFKKKKNRKNSSNLPSREIWTFVGPLLTMKTAVSTWILERR